jgi:hypothetical protein
MEVAVWDTYVENKEGYYLHFDIIVPVGMKDPLVIYEYGKQYLESIHEDATEINAEACQLCHIEEPTEETISSIERQGYYILRMEDIPPALPENPGRREMILHLRAHFPSYRFANFKGLSEEEVRNILQDLKNKPDDR